MEKGKFVKTIRERLSGGRRDKDTTTSTPLEAGKTESVARDFARLVMKTVTVEELNSPRFGVGQDGIPRLIVDHETFISLRRENSR